MPSHDPRILIGLAIVAIVFLPPHHLLVGRMAVFHEEE
jgi:hypothetical protein